jgi:hypothetical protein
MPDAPADRTTVPWSALVFARTRLVDEWWQVRPEQVDARWLAEVVITAVAGGRGLRPGPRFLFAQRPGVRVIGVVDYTSRFGSAMDADQSRRPTYGLVGWAASYPGGQPPPVPVLDRLVSCAAAWARPLYDRALEPVWEEARLRSRPVSWPAEPPPWGDDLVGLPAGQDASSADPGELPPHDSEIYLAPAGHASALWQSAAASGRDFILVTGWPSSADIHPTSSLTHACAADVTQVYRRPRPAADPPPARYQPGSGGASRLGRDYDQEQPPRRQGQPASAATGPGHPTRPDSVPTGSGDPTSSHPDGDSPRRARRWWVRVLGTVLVVPLLYWTLRALVRYIIRAVKALWATLRQHPSGEPPATGDGSPAVAARESLPAPVAGSTPQASVPAPASRPGGTAPAPQRRSIGEDYDTA